ncbi:MAG: transposase [Chloroflexi bacterium]|nr:transposase [Chloroflexota bacterium]
MVTGRPLGHRRSIRLRGYDYRQAGAYFITIVTHARTPLLGTVVDGDVLCNAWGKIVTEEWARTADVRPNVLLDAFVVMPNHIHGIIIITDVVGTNNVGANRRLAPTGYAPAPPPPGSIGAIMAQFKSATTKRINALRDMSRAPVWQRNYYEHVVRDETELATIRGYIEDNPARWVEDPENPSVTPHP